MKNFYEILEIDQNASQEIVDKAYKVLVKKYHPDLQRTPEEKAMCEEKIKQVNEAYETISNPELRIKYDNMLREEYQRKLQMQQEGGYQRVIKKQQDENPNIKRDQHEQEYQKRTQKQQWGEYKGQNAQNEQHVNQQAQYSGQNNQDYQKQRQQTIREMAEHERQYQEAINKAYNDAYIQDLKNRGYKIRYKKTLNDHLRSLIALLITIGIITLVLQLPFVKNYINELYKNNGIIRGIIDTLSNLFK